MGTDDVPVLLTAVKNGLRLIITGEDGDDQNPAYVELLQSAFDSVEVVFAPGLFSLLGFWVPEGVLKGQTTRN